MILYTIPHPGDGCHNRVRATIMVFGGALPHRVQHGQVLSFSFGRCCCVHCTEDSCKRAQLGPCPSTTLWLHWIPAQVCYIPSPESASYSSLSYALADDVKPITYIFLAHSAAPHTLNDLWQGMCNNDDSFPKQGRYWTVVHKKYSNSSFLCVAKLTPSTSIKIVTASSWSPYLSPYLS